MTIPLAADIDVLIIGAGAAGLFAAITAGQRGRSVLVLDHQRDPGEKIRISGGGRCNFTNVNGTVKTGRERFLSQNPRFALSCLSRYSPQDFIALVDRYGISWHEKTLGQLFCDGSSTQIVAMLMRELADAGGRFQASTTIDSVTRGDGGFIVETSRGPLRAKSLVIATGGKSIPKMGATGFGYRLAEQFGLRVTDTRPALVPLTFETGALAKLKPLAGISLEAGVRHGRTTFEEALLFTHRGLSGPAILQISSYWREGDAISINLLPALDVMATMRAARQESPKLAIQTVLAAHLPKRLAQAIGDELGLPGIVGDFSDRKFETIAKRLTDWQIKPVGSEGYRTAEVTLGGIDTRDLDATTMMARAVPGLHFVGEVVDVTGWLGGYNFQWAWASGFVAGQAV